MTRSAPQAALHTLGSGTTALPRLVHHDGDGARIELSGRVLLNWAAKAGNLLVEEFDVAPGDVVAIDLPAGHWRAAYWALAAWGLGGSVDVTPDADGADVLVTNTARAAAGAGPRGAVVAVTPAALARRSDVELPAGVFDEAAVLATYADVAPPVDDLDAADDVLTDGDAAWTVADLALDLPADPGGEPAEASPRYLLAPADADPATALRAMVAAWAADAAVVVAPPGATPEQLERLAAGERTGPVVEF